MTGKPLPPATLVLGGAASGKSLHAESLVLESGLAPVYVATASADDDEMAARISGHRARRGEAWTTFETPIDLAGRLRETARPGAAILVDCLTLWLSNLLMERRDAAAETEALASALEAAGGPVVLVSNEIGYGIVPEDSLSRRFRDLHGALNRTVAAAADRVVLVAAGLPLVLKEAGP